MVWHQEPETAKKMTTTTQPPELEPLAPDQLWHPCACDRLGFEDTTQLEPLEQIIGQERALDAIGFGTGIERPGYNLFVMGSTGLGRHTTLHEALSRQAAGAPPAPDWCYVANFDAPDRPHVLELPAGRGRTLRRDMQQLVEDLLNAIPAAFQSDTYRRRLQEINDAFKEREEKAATALAEKAKEKGIALIRTPTGFNLVPMKGEKLLEPKEFEALSEEEKQRVRETIEEIEGEMRDALAQVPLWQRELRKRIQALDRDVTELTVAQLIQELERSYQDLPKVLDYLHAVKEDVIEYAPAFAPDVEDVSLNADDPRFTRYRVNLLVDNGNQSGPPVIYENNPTYQNLVGRIEHIARMGTLVTDFTLIKPGALHRANGGYLILDAVKVLGNPFAWDALKRALNASEIRIEPLERLLSITATVTLEPQSVPLRVKVALVGERLLFYLLKAYDPEFCPLFKIAADFSEDMPRNGDADLLYARLIATLQGREGLRPLSRQGVCRLIDWAVRQAGDGERLSLEVGNLLDLLQESDYVAAQAQAEQVDAGHIQDAIDARNRRMDQARERLRDAILDNVLMVDTSGIQLAQVNGLSVMEIGDYRFGFPTRISATARIGSGDVVDIEREIELGGAIHAKGVMILSSYLANRYARNMPLSMAASLVFEQSYRPVEGDSASVAELCALLSAIGDMPINQALAITGSVNQHGQVQAIGAVNEKIEGFFDICRERGLTGDQGVIIPRANVRHLMLRGEVREAAREGRFHIYAADHVDQVISLCTGLPAGHPDANGIYPEDSANGRVQRRLFEWTSLRQQYGAALRPTV